MSEEVFRNLIQDYAIYVAGVSTIIGGLIVVYKKVIKPVIKHFQQWYDMTDKIDKIFEELTPNGGTSIKDKIDKIDKDLILYKEVQRALLQESEFAHFEMDADGNYIWVNRTYTRLVERTPSELMGHGWYNCVAQDEREAVIAACMNSIKENRELSMTFNFETPSGKKIKVRGGSYKMTDQKGDTIGFFGRLRVL